MDRSPGPVDAPLPVAKCWHGFLRRRDRAEKIKEGAEALGQVIAANTYALGEVFFELSASPGSRDGNAGPFGAGFRSSLLSRMDLTEP